jgi:hypothetical protein
MVFLKLTALGLRDGIIDDVAVMFFKATLELVDGGIEEVFVDYMHDIEVTYSTRIINAAAVWAEIYIVNLLMHFTGVDESTDGDGRAFCNIYKN